MSDSGTPRAGWAVNLRVLAVEATRGTPLYAGLLMLVVSVVAAASLGSLNPGWAGPLNNGAATSVFLAPLTAGAAVVHVQLRARRGWLDAAASTPRGRAGALVLSLAGFLAVAGFALLAGTSVALVRADLDGAFTPAMLVMPGMAFTMCAAAAATGVLLGDSTRWRLAGPAIAIVLYGVGVNWIFLRLEGRSWLLWLEPFPLDFFYSGSTEPNTDLWLPKIAALAAVTVAVILLLHRRRVLGGVALAAGAAGLAVAAAIVPPEVVRFRTPPDDPPCLERAGVRVCTWPELTGPAPDLLAAAVQVREDNEAVLPSLPDTYVQRGLESAFPGAAIVDILTVEDPRAVISDVRRASLPSSRCPDLVATDEQRDGVVRLMGARAGESLMDEPGIEALAETSDEAQAAWVAERLADAEALCDQPQDTP